MMFGISEAGERTHITKAEKRAHYTCPGCGALLIQKKGEINAWHFAHAAGTACEAFTENKMTEWHLKHQEEFPEYCREIRLKAGRKVHIADIMSGTTIIEFQHSPIDPRVFTERSMFYSCWGTLHWVFDCCESYSAGRLKCLDRYTRHGDDKFTWVSRPWMEFIWKRAPRMFDGYCDLSMANVPFEIWFDLGPYVCEVLYFYKDAKGTLRFYARVIDSSLFHDYISRRITT